MARQNTDQDSLNVGDFKGMATAGGSYSASPEYLQYLINATTTRSGTLKQRGGSQVIQAGVVSGIIEYYQFSFAGETWLVYRNGTSFILYKAYLNNGEIFTLEVHCIKNSVLRSASANEPATYATKTEGQYCHILVATTSTSLISLCLCSRDLVFSSVTSTTAVTTLGQWYTFGQATNNNSRLVIGGALEATTNLTNTNEVYTFTWASRPAYVLANTKAKLISCFWLRFVDANYYRGLDLFNVAVRRNTIPLDVNVEVPDSIRTNYIYNEPSQDLSIESVKAYTTTTVGATSYTKVTNKQPLVNTSWDFSDGSYRAVSSQLTTRTPNFIAFGGLETNALVNKINLCRLRTVLVGSLEYTNINDLLVHVDYNSAMTPVWHNTAGAVITSGVPKYFSYIATASTAPGVGLESVVELMYVLESTGGTGAYTNFVVNISSSLDSVAIGDGWAVPLYGYGLVAKQKSFSFPNVVRVINNRMLLGGSNRLLVSSSDWNYRGISFNNCQISTLNFNENSPYLVELEQAAGNAKAIESVNGVVVVAADNGTYRISGANYNSPPNATTATISRITNQSTFANGLGVFDNQVYMANAKGLYKVNYDRSSDSAVLEELSLPVSNLFTDQPDALSYSHTLQSIVIKLKNNNKLLRYDLLSKTFSYLQIAVPYNIAVYASLDGFSLFNSGNLILATWSNLQTSDLTNSGFISFFTIAANTASVGTSPTDTYNLVTPPELQQKYAFGGAVVLPAFNFRSRAVGSSTIVTETTAGNVPKPVLAYAVTKALYGAKLTTASRMRSLVVLLAGVGYASVGISEVRASNRTLAKQPIYDLITDAFGNYVVQGAITAQGGQLVYPTSDTLIVRLGSFGISEAFNVAFALDGLELVGFQLNTSAKAQSKLQ